MKKNKELWTCFRSMIVWLNNKHKFDVGIRINLEEGEENRSVIINIEIVTNT